MALFVLRKYILQTRMRSHPVGLDVWCLVGPFVYFHTSCVRTAKALTRLRGCAGSSEPSLVHYVISTIISWAGSFVFCNLSYYWKAWTFHYSWSCQFQWHLTLWIAIRFCSNSCSVVLKKNTANVPKFWTLFLFYKMLIHVNAVAAPQQML